MARVCFIQEMGEASQTFRFEDDRLVVAESDARTAREFELPYLELDLQTPSEEPPRRGLLARLINPARRVHARFALFEPRRGRDAIAIWAGEQAQDIVAELSQRWRDARLRAVTVDFASDPRREIGRFQLLMERGIVSAEEAAAAVARIVAKTRVS